MEANELRDMSVEELNDELLALRREQFNLRMQQATGELTQHHQHRKVRKDIARIKTVLNEMTREADKSE